MKNIAIWCFGLVASGVAIASVVDVNGNPTSAVVSNGKISVGVGSIRTPQPSRLGEFDFGGAIDSFKIDGVEMLNQSDAGRVWQHSLFFANHGLAYSYDQNACEVSGEHNSQVNPQEAGDDLSRPKAIVYYKDQRTAHIVTRQVPSWASTALYPEGLELQSIIRVGPLPYAPYQEIVELEYATVNRNQSSPLCPARSAILIKNATTEKRIKAPFVPAIYFDYNRFSELWGLNEAGQWSGPLPVYTAAMVEFDPSQYRYRAMAWCQSGGTRCVGIYSKSAWDNSRNAGGYAGFNFAAENYPNVMPGTQTRSLKVLDYTPVLLPGQEHRRKVFAMTGDLAKLKEMVSTLVAQGL